MKRIVVQLLVAAALALAAASSIAAGDEFAALGFLLGSWEASGGGQPGDSAGVMTFTPDVQGHALVRRNESRSPDGVHSDLTIVFRDPTSKALRAQFVDSEGHVIAYDVTTSTNPNRAVFVQAPTNAQPGFRFTYLQTGPDTLDLQFEVAPPGGTFSTYLHGAARRK
jgi:hypothetical protein